MDPNTSLLRMFDPIHGNATPARLDPHSNNDELTMSTFFNKISSQRPSSEVPSFSENRRSLIDFSFDDIPKSSGDDSTPTKAVVAHSIAPSLRKSLTPSFRDSVESATPINLRTLNVFQPSKPVPNETRHVSGNSRSKHPPPSPSKFSHHLTIDREPRHSRRSSLDVSALTLNIKDRLAQEDMSFDIINDEISILSELTESDAPTAVTNASQSISSKVPKTAPALITEFVLPPLSFESNSVLHKDKLTSLESNTTLPALPTFDFGAESILSTLNIQPDDNTEKDGVATRPARKPRKSIFDALENTPTASTKDAPPNIVTSWDAPSGHAKAKPPVPGPDFKHPVVPRVSRHTRTLSTSSNLSVTSATFKTPYAPISGKAKTVLPSVAASPEPQKRTSDTDSSLALRQVGRDIRESSRSRPSQISRVEDIGDPAVPTLTSLRRTKTTISAPRTGSSLAPIPDTATLRPGSTMEHRFREPRGTSHTTQNVVPSSRAPISRASTLDALPPSMAFPAGPGTLKPSRTLSRTNSVQGLPSNRLSVVSMPLVQATARSQSRIGMVTPAPRRLVERNTEREAEREKLKSKDQGLRDWASGVASATEAPKKQKENVVDTGDGVSMLKRRPENISSSYGSTTTLNSKASHYPVRPGSAASHIVPPTPSTIPSFSIRPHSSVYNIRSKPSQAEARVPSPVESKATSTSTSLRPRPSLYNIRAGASSTPALPDPSKNLLSTSRPTSGIYSVPSAGYSTTVLTSGKSLSRASSLLRSKSRTQLPVRPA